MIVPPAPDGIRDRNRDPEPMESLFQRDWHGTDDTELCGHVDQSPRFTWVCHGPTAHPPGNHAFRRHLPSAVKRNR